MGVNRNTPMANKYQLFSIPYFLYNFRPPMRKIMFDDHAYADGKLNSDNFGCHNGSLNNTFSDKGFVLLVYGEWEGIDRNGYRFICFLYNPTSTNEVFEINNACLSNGLI